MAIPNTDTFSLQDVVTEIVPTTNDLIDCFADAVSGSFDAEYSGTKTQLLNFRNYGAGPSPAKFGYLYNTYAAKNANIAPAGWRIPSQSDVDTLITFLGGLSVSGGKLKQVGLDYWNTPNTDATDDYSFADKGTGLRGLNGIFSNNKIFSYIWTTQIQFSQLYYFSNSSSNGQTLRAGFNDKVGCGIRLIKNDSTNPGTLTDYDGNSYITVTIGTQVWTAAYWKCTHLNEGTQIPTVTGTTAWAALTTLAKCAYNNDEANV